MRHPIHSRKWARFLGYRVSVSGKSKPKPSANSNTPAAVTICGVFWKTEHPPPHPSPLLPSRSGLGKPPLVDDPYRRTTRALSENFHDSRSNLMELCSGFGIGLPNGSRHAGVTRSADVGIKSYTPEEWNAETFTFLLPPTMTKDLGFLPTIRTRKKAHVFNDPKQGSANLFKHLRTFCDVQQRQVLRSGDQDRSGQRDRLCQGELYIPGSRR